jgi:flagellar export protein FliJ
MMGFKFSLQAVLNQREANEERCQREYSMALAQLETLRRRRVQIDEEIEHCRDRIARGQRDGMDWDHRRLIEQWIDHQKEEGLRVDRLCEEANENVERKRRQLTEANQQTRIMEKLREREYGDWRLGERRAEAKAFDEFAMRRHDQRKRRPGLGDTGKTCP